jgi:hypothetical protein
MIVARIGTPIDDEISVTLHHSEIASCARCVASDLDRSPNKAMIVVWIGTPIDDEISVTLHHSEILVITRSYIVS